MQLHEKQEARPTYHSQRANDLTVTRHDTTALSVALHVVYKGLFVMCAALLLLLVLGPVMLP